MRKFPVAITALALGLLLAACGEEDPVIIEPTPSVEDPLAFFGASPCACFEYAPASEWEDGLESFSRKLGVAVENVSGATRLGRAYHNVRFRMNGHEVVRQEFWDPTDPDLLLAGINLEGATNDPWVKFDPPVSLVRAPVESDRLVRSSAQTSLVGPGTSEEGPEVTLRAQYRPEEEVEIGYWDEVERNYLRETVTSTPIGLSGTQGMESGQVRWFVPEVGFVKLRLNLEGETNDWVLVRTRWLDAESCDRETGKGEPLDQCGI